MTKLKQKIAVLEREIAFNKSILSNQNERLQDITVTPATFGLTVISGFIVSYLSVRTRGQFGMAAIMFLQKMYHGVALAKQLWGRERQE